MLSDEELQDRAKEFLDSAISDKEADPPRRFACLMNAINPAELAGKSLLVQATGAYPREHRIAGTLAHHGLIPLEVEERAVSDLFERYLNPAMESLHSSTMKTLFEQSRSLRPSSTPPTIIRWENFILPAPACEQQVGDFEPS